jgi:hypothetical protein
LILVISQTAPKSGHSGGELANKLTKNPGNKRHRGFLQHILSKKSAGYQTFIGGL